MKKLAKILSLGLVATSMCSMVACGGGGGDMSSIDPNDTRRSVVFEYLDAGFGDAPYEALKKGFEARNPEVRIDLYPNRELTGTLNNNLSSPNTQVSDVYSYMYPNALKTWISKGYVEDLTDICGKNTLDGRTMRESMTGNAAESMMLDGKIYAVPEYTNVVGFVYNQNLFEQYGWQIPNTTAELKTLCDKILADTNGKVKPFTWCQDASGYLYFATESWITQYMGIANLDSFYEYNSKDIYATSDSNPMYSAKYNALNNVVDFLSPENEWTNDKSRTTEYMDAQYQLIKGDYAMMLNGAWFENEMQLELEAYPDAKLGMFAIPEMTDSNGAPMRAAGYTTVDNKRVVSASYGAYYFIPSRAANKEDAKDFMLYLSSKEACELYTQYSNVVRPFDYDFGEGSALYNKVSNFGKSVLKLADQHYLYTPISSSPLDWIGVAGLWPSGGRVEESILAKSADTNPDTYLTKDKNFVDINWDVWLRSAGMN